MEEYDEKECLSILYESSLQIFLLITKVNRIDWEQEINLDFKLEIKIKLILVDCHFSISKYDLCFSPTQDFFSYREKLFFFPSKL